MNDQLEGAPFTELSLEECWELLRAHALGRLAFHLADQVHITPINYAVDRDTLLFRTDEGSKLLGVVMNDDVAFEIDGENGHTAWSVVVRGRAELLDERSAHRADDLQLRPWTGTHKYNVVEITPTTITGRRFVLHEHARRPWLDS
jgi:nitroimidazol reductase NimA-like FMN-containing flavoprotein (pyridoxamine 5'-phosphate oxidase superfamily)